MPVDVPRSPSDRTSAVTAAGDLTGEQFSVWVLLHGSRLTKTCARELALSWGKSVHGVRRALTALIRKGYLSRCEFPRMNKMQKYSYTLERRLDASSGLFYRFAG